MIPPSANDMQAAAPGVVESAAVARDGDQEAAVNDSSAREGSSRASPAPPPATSLSADADAEVVQFV
jgi:hypothetical protein